MWIVGGSVPERVVSVEEGKEDDIFNTCLCINPEGTIVGKHRKVHLFDINVPGGITFFESDTLSAGNTLTAFDVGEPLGMVGVGICYDIRFPEYSLLLCQKHKCNVLIFPGAFNLTTGPAHWELLQKGRAVDNQCYVMTAAPARTEDPASGPGGKLVAIRTIHLGDTRWWCLPGGTSWRIATKRRPSSLQILKLKRSEK